FGAHLAFAVVLFAATISGNQQAPVGDADTGGDPLPRATPETVGLIPARFNDATDLLKQFVVDRKIAGAVAAVSRQGKLVYLERVGYQNIDARTLMQPNSLFRIYSMTKSVTAVAAMMLRDEGKFSLQDPVSKYLPEFRRVAVRDADGTTRSPVREITIEDLLLHTSGLSHRTSELYRSAEVRSRAFTMDRFIGNIVPAPLMEDPHTASRYS